MSHALPVLIPAPRRAALILVGGFSTAAAILSLWLLYWLVVFQMPLKFRTLWVGPPPRSTASTSLLFQEPDAKAFGAVTKGEATPVAGDLAGKIRTFLEVSGRSPSLVFLSAVGFVAADEEAGTAEAYLASQELLAGVIPAGIPTPRQADKLSDVVNAFKNSPERRLGPRLLILDVGRVG
ncbi:MAG: hypothetical protein AB7I30_24420, partial [Isosphaeraceae bacterium]